MNKESTTIKKTVAIKHNQKRQSLCQKSTCSRTTTWREKERYDVDDNRIPFYGQRQAKGMPLNANTFLIWFGFLLSFFFVCSYKIHFWSKSRSTFFQFSLSCIFVHFCSLLMQQLISRQKLNIVKCNFLS